MKIEKSRHLMTKNRTCMKMNKIQPDMMGDGGIINDRKMDKKH